MELNGLSETVIEEGTSLTVPYTLVYCKGRSAELIANYARVSLDEVKKLNNVKDSQEIYPEEKYLIVKALEKDKTSYKTLNEEKQNIICGTVIKGDKVIECGKTFSEGSVTSLLSLTKNENEENKVEYIEIKNDGSMYVCSLAENVKDITVSNNIPVIICNNELDMYLKSISGEAEENYRTKINTQNITEEYYLYKMDDGTNIVSLDKIVEYGEPDKTIGGKQKTIG